MAQQDFIFELTIGSPVTIDLPFVDVAPFDCTVDWGDGAVDTITAYNDPNRSHAYSTGVYQVSISGYCGGWKVDSTAIKDYITDIVQFGTQTLFQTRAFRGCSLLSDVTATDFPGFRRGQEEYFFSSCPINLDLTNAYMGDGRLWRGFWGGGNLGNPSGWDISRGEYFQSWLGGAEWNYDITPLKDTIAVGVTDRTVKTWDGFFNANSIFNCGDDAGVYGNRMKWFRTYGAQLRAMFSGCDAFNQDISTNVQNPGQPDEYVAWDISGVDDISSMFNGCDSFNQDLSSWDTSSVTNMASTFSSSAFNQDLGSWNTSSVTNMTSMFAYSVFNNGGVGGVGVGLDGWDVSNVTNFSSMFIRQYSYGFNQYIGSWVFKPAASINVSSMFQENYNFNQDIGGWTNTSSFTDCGLMFRGASSFNNGDAAGVAGGGLGVGLDTWDTSNVTSMRYMFNGASAFNQYIDSWNVSSVTTMDRMFSGATSFNRPLNSWNVSSVTNMSNMFKSANVFNQPLNSWNTASVTDMSLMFNNATAFNQSLNSWNTASVTTMLSMFQLASAFDQDLSGWDVHSLTICDSLFFDSNISDANLESTLYAWSLDPLTASNVSALNICRPKTYATGSNMDLALNDPTNGLVAAKNWNITGITIV